VAPPTPTGTHANWTRSSKSASAHDAGLHLCTNDDETVTTRTLVSASEFATRKLRTPCRARCSLPAAAAATTRLSAVPSRPVLKFLRAVDAPHTMTFDILANHHTTHLRVLAGALRARDLGALEHAPWASVATGHSSRASRPRGADPVLRADLVDTEKWEVQGLREDVGVDMAVAGGRCGCADSSLRRCDHQPRKRARCEMASRRM